jgi:hypothetical protein
MPAGLNAEKGLGRAGSRLYIAGFPEFGAKMDR